MRRMRHMKPREIQSCYLALDASIASSLYDATSGGSLVAADGAVARWEDQSGNARHATQSTSAYRPLRKSTIMNIGALQFDGVDDQVTFTGSGSDPNTLIAVCKWDDPGQTGTRGIIAFGDVNQANGGMLLMQPSTGAQIGSFSGSLSYSTYTPSSAAFAAALVDAGQGTHDYFVNCKPEGVGVSGNPVGQFQNHVGGAHDTPKQSTKMSVGLAVIYSIALSNYMVRRALESGMRKWRISG